MLEMVVSIEFCMLSSVELRQNTLITNIRGDYPKNWGMYTIVYPITRDAFSHAPVPNYRAKLVAQTHGVCVSYFGKQRTNGL